MFLFSAVHLLVFIAEWQGAPDSPTNYIDSIYLKSLYIQQHNN